MKLDKSTHHINTVLTHSGRKDKSHQGPVNTPVIRASTILFPDVAALKSAYGTRNSYGRHGTETTLALEDALCAAEGADACFITPSGLSAITTTLLALLKPGDHLLMVDSCYGPNREFCDGMLSQLNIQTTYYNPLIVDEIEKLIQKNTKVIFIESPGSLSFEMQDVPAIAKMAHAHGLVVVADNTWATPIGWSPFELGIDISIHAATKYIVGHSDALMGSILCKEAHTPILRFTYKQLGMSISGDDAALALRGLRTLSARLALHKINSFHVANWLLEQKEVEKILYPPHPQSAGHELWKRDFNTDFACGLMGVVFKEGVTMQQVNALIDQTKLFGIGFSWGGYESLILPITIGSSRALTTSQSNAAMMRLHIGLEAYQDLIQDLDHGFNSLRKTEP